MWQERKKQKRKWHQFIQTENVKELSMVSRDSQSNTGIDKNDNSDDIILKDSRKFWGSPLVPAFPAPHHGDLGSSLPKKLS